MTLRGKQALTGTKRVGFVDLGVRVIIRVINIKINKTPWSFVDDWVQSTTEREGRRKRGGGGGGGGGENGGGG